MLKHPHPFNRNFSLLTGDAPAPPVGGGGSPIGLLLGITYASGSASGNFVLREDGGYALREDNFKIIRES